MWTLKGDAQMLCQIRFCQGLLGLQREMGRGIEKDLDGNPFAGLAKAMVQSVSLDVGVGVVVIGAALLIAAAVVPPRKRA
jgi:hypothetical protein